MEYTILHVCTSAIGSAQIYLQLEVMKLISIGWKPSGGVQVQIFESDFGLSKVHMFQAMIKE